MGAEKLARPHVTLPDVGLASLVPAAPDKQLQN
jgi:hypothetical protein